MTATDASRRPGHDIDALFHERWSPRAFSEAEISAETLEGLFEAARWAPSAMNAQPWRFVWARRGTPAFDRLLATLAPANQAWAHRAAALVALASAETLSIADQGAVPSTSHAFDAGAAWAQLALQAHLWGWGTHAIGGFDRAAAAEAVGLPPAHRLEVVIAIGRRGDPETLPAWAKARERPNGRRPVSELAFEGRFPGR